MLKKDVLRIKGILKNQLLAGPETVCMDITNKCNLKCSFCWVHSPLVKNKLEPAEMDYKLIKNIINDCSDMGVEEIILTGEGEPLLHSKIEKIVNCIKKKNMKVELTTNATLFNNITKIANKISHFYINLPSSRIETYRKLQFKNPEMIFKKLIKNIRFLSENRNHAQKIALVFIINNENFMEIENMIKLASGLNTNELDFRFMVATNEIKNLIISEKNKKELKNNIKKILHRKIKIENNLSEIYSALSNYEQSVYNIKRCYMGWLNVFIYLNGDVAPCCNNGNLIVGNIHRDSLKKIWRSSEFHKARLKSKYLLNKENDLWEECRLCHEAKISKNIDKSLNSIK